MEQNYIKYLEIYFTHTHTHTHSYESSLSQEPMEYVVEPSGTSLMLISPCNLSDQGPYPGCWHHPWAQGCGLPLKDQEFSKVGQGAFYLFACVCILADILIPRQVPKLWKTNNVNDKILIPKWHLLDNWHAAFPLRFFFPPGPIFQMKHSLSPWEVKL